MRKREDRLPFCRPWIGEEEAEAVAEVLRSGWITYGPRTVEFERRFAELTGAEYATAVSSGTAALHLILLALGVGPGDEVIMPTLTFASDPNVVEFCGARPVFCDVDPRTLLMDVESAASLVTERTRAVIAVHYTGAPVDVEALAAALPSGGPAIIEDAAHAAGTELRGRHVGALARAGFFSFHPIKNVTAGEGGMITTNDAALHERIRRLRYHGIDKDAWQRYGRRATGGYDVEYPGLKYNTTDIHSAVGLVQLDKLERANARRAEIHRRYREALADVEEVRFPEDPPWEHTHARHLAVVMVEDRERTAAALRDDWNVDTGLHFPLCHELTYYRRKYGERSLPAAEEAGRRILSLPLFPGMSDEDIDYVAAAVREAVKV